MPQRWVQNTTNRTIFVGGEQLLPGEGTFVDDGPLPQPPLAGALNAAEIVVVQALARSGRLETETGAVFGLSEITPVQTVTATATAYTGAGYYRGIKVRAIVGGPQTLTIYDALSATGTPIDTIVVNSLGTWFWDRPSDVLPGVGSRRPITTGIHVVVTGGTSRTVDVMVEPVV